MIVITGAAGFIASVLLSYLNEKVPGEDIIIVDNFSQRIKDKNYKNSMYISCVERDAFPAYFEENHEKISFLFHMGARTDTAEMDVSIFDRLNLNYSKRLWKICVEHKVPMIYASSAATYGDGSLGYNDDHEIINDLKPLNPYGRSKNDFDKWVLDQNEKPPFWAGLKFFNVYGPNEYHKGRMASVIFHAFNQIRVSKKMKLFRSHRDDFLDGQQERDFIYVKDVVRICHFLFEKQRTLESGIYNLGTGQARTFEDLVKAVFTAMGLKDNISYIDMPEDIRDKYQYFTCAKMDKLISQGYTMDITSLEEGVKEYVQKYLFEKTYF